MRRGVELNARVRERKERREDVLREQAMSRNIREPAIGKVGESAEVGFGSWADVVAQVSGNGAFLVRRAREVVAETSGAGGPGDFRANGLGATD